ncbi:MAG: tRNA pseudouridine(38-40) synthase TruA, partial [Cytophagales bacterium]|nr:tRNA pseudouridine(38-40) synthase TruA [Cytophagales bacterium]
YFIDKITPTVWDPAYPQGLFLSKVNYPYLCQPAKTNFDSILLAETWKVI